MNIVRVGVSSLCAVILAVALLGLGISGTASSMVLDSTFIRSELQRTDAYLLLFEEARERIPSELSFLLPIIDEAEADLEPWAREQVTHVVLAGHAYVTESKEFDAVVSLREAKSYLMTRLQSMMANGLPEGFPEVPSSHEEAFLDLIEREVDARLPARLVVDETVVGDEFMMELRKARRYAGYATTGLWVLPIVAIVMILVIAFVQTWRGGLISAYAGAAFIASGAASVILTFATRQLAPGLLGVAVPAVVEPVIPGFVYRVTGPLLLYGVISLAIGVALVIVAYRLLRSKA
ncbi:MAG: hypothetical protein ACOC9B_04480 [Chloroflexota bacterium]